MSPLLLRLQLIAVLLLAVATAAGQQCADAGDSLDDLREEVEENDDHGDETSNSAATWADSDGDADDELEEQWGKMLMLALSSPWWGPYVALGDDFYDEGEFMVAPYDWGIPGHLVLGYALQPTVGYTGRVSFQYGTDFTDLQWSTLRAQYDTTSRFGFDTEWTWWVESTRTGSDMLSTGDANLLYRFAQSEQVEFHTGIGLNWLADGSDGEAGVNFTYSVDVFPVEPWTLSASVDAGTLGDAGYIHGRAGGGAVWGWLEFFAGYEFYRFGDVDLDGMFAGAALWF